VRLPASRLALARHGHDVAHPHEPPARGDHSTGVLEERIRAVPPPGSGRGADRSTCLLRRGSRQMDISDPRFRIAASRRMLYREGCDSGVAGHVSERAADGDSFWVSAFGYFDETTPDTVLRYSFDLDLLEGEAPASPAVEFHAAVYRERPDVQSVIH